MNLSLVRGLWTRILVPALLLALAASCASTTTSSKVIVPADQSSLVAGDEEYGRLIAQLRSDLNQDEQRQAALSPLASRSKTATPSSEAKRQRDATFAARAKALFAPLSGNPLTMPVVGVYAAKLDDSWHAPRDGGSRVHKGIDILAPRGTPVVAVMDGVISFIGDQKLGGHCIWLTTEEGMSFYYAHLDRWAAGLYEGMEVQRGDLIGYVGNTGNAIHTVTHLHFGISQNDEMVDPYPVLVRAVPALQAHAHTTSGGILSGSR